MYFQVFKNLKLFLEKKQPGDDLFDRLNVSVLAFCTLSSCVTFSSVTFVKSTTVTEWLGNDENV